MRLALHSIQTRITLATLIIFAAGLWSLAFYVGRLLQADMERVSGEQQVTTVSFIAVGLNDEFNHRMKALETVAVEVGPAMLGNAATLQGFIERRPVFQLLFNAGTFITGIDGTAIASIPTSLGRVGISYMDRDFIIAALKDGKTTIGKPVMGKQLNSPIFVMAVPIRDTEGRVIGSLAGVTDLGKPNFLDKVANNRYGKTGGYVLVARQSRLVVTATDKSRIMEPLPATGTNVWVDRFAQGYEGSAVSANPRGVEMLVSGKSVPVAEWYLLVVLPTAEAFAPIQDMKQRLLFATLFVTLLASTLTWWVLRRQLAPMLATTKALAALSATDIPPQTLPVTSQDEIGDLIGGFNRLLEILKQRKEDLQASEIFKNAILNSMPTQIAVLDRNGVISATNEAWQRFSDENSTMSGVQVQHTGIGTNYLNICQASLGDSSEGAGQVYDGIRGVLEGCLPVFAHEYACHSPSEQRWFSMSVTPLSAQGDGVVVVHTNVTERKIAEEKVKLAASVFHNSREGIMITDMNAKIIEVNDAFSRITGFSGAEVVGQSPRILSSGLHEKPYYSELWSSLLGKGHWYGEVWNRRKNGEIYAELLTISAVNDQQGNAKNFVAIFSDITVYKKHHDNINYLAHYDALTGLSNRLLFSDRLHQAMAQAERREQSMAVVFLDLDGFKAINDNHGHEAGDQLLITIAHRMKEVIREGDTLARFGGDEFVALLTDLPEVASAEATLLRLLAAAAQPVSHGDLVLQVSASVGVTFFPQGEPVDASELLRQADTAMYQAKESGKNRYCIFEENRTPDT